MMLDIIVHGDYQIEMNKCGEIKDIVYKGESIGTEMGAILRNEREINKISVESIASTVNKSLNYIYQIEKHQRNASPSFLRELATAYAFGEHYILLAFVEGFISMDEYITLSQKSFPIIDVYELLRGNNTVYYDGRLLNSSDKHMMLGGLEIINARQIENNKMIKES